MAGRREHRREKDQSRAGPPGSSELDHVMGGAGDQGAAETSGPRPTASPEMNPRAQQCRQPDIASHNQRQPARAADPGQVTTEAAPVGLAIMAQDNAGKASRQPLGRRARIGQAARVGEEPERGKPRSGPGRHGMRPGKKACVHGVSRLACATQAPVLTRSGP